VGGAWSIEVVVIRKEGAALSSLAPGAAAGAGGGLGVSMLMLLVLVLGVVSCSVGLGF